MINIMLFVCGYLTIGFIICIILCIFDKECKEYILSKHNTAIFPFITLWPVVLCASMLSGIEKFTLKLATAIVEFVLRRKS